MNKQEVIAKFKQLKESAVILKEVARQQINTATRLETLADSVLEELGNSTGRGRKVKYQLTPELEMQFRASLTRGRGGKV